MKDKKTIINDPSTLRSQFFFSQYSQVHCSISYLHSDLHYRIKNFLFCTYARKWFEDTDERKKRTGLLWIGIYPTYRHSRWLLYTLLILLPNNAWIFFKHSLHNAEPSHYYLIIIALFITSQSYRLLARKYVSWKSAVCRVLLNLIVKVWREKPRVPWKIEQKNHSVTPSLGVNIFSPPR